LEKGYIISITDKPETIQTGTSRAGQTRGGRRRAASWFTLRVELESRIFLRMQNQRFFLWIAATAAALFLITSGGRLYVNDSHIKLSTSHSIVERGSSAIPPFGQLTVVSPKTGKNYSKYEILHSLFFLPASLTAKSMVAAGWVAPELRAPLEGFLASTLNPILAGLAAGLLYLLIIELFGNRRSAITMAALFSIATMVWPYSKRSWTEIPQLTLLVAAAWLLAAARRNPSHARLLGAGLCFGGVLALRVTGIVLLPPLLLFLLLSPFPRRGSFGRIALFSGGIALAVIPLIGAVNILQFGSLFDLYRWRSGGFTTPFLEGLTGFLISPGESIFLYSPILIAALPAAPGMWKTDRGAFCLAYGIPSALMLLYASWWFHAYTWGPRFLLPAIPFLLVPIARHLTSSRGIVKASIVTLAALSLLVQVPGVLFHLGDLPQLGEPLIRAGWLPPDGRLIRADTWHHPLRTRMASHFLVLIESVPPILGGTGSSVPFDFWPATIRETLRIPSRASLPAGAALIGFFLFGLFRIKQLWRDAG